MDVEGVSGLMDGTITILHADGDFSVAELTTSYLEHLDDRFRITTETTGRDALDHLSTSDVDRVVSDHQMPGWMESGIAPLCREQGGRRWDSVVASDYSVDIDGVLVPHEVCEWLRHSIR